MWEDLAVGMKEEPCLFLFKDCAPAFRFDYRGAAIHQGRLRVDAGRPAAGSAVECHEAAADVKAAAAKLPSVAQFLTAAAHMTLRRWVAALV